MDTGLGVRWPLSPYATALAAGALFAFCVALWKYQFGTRQRIVRDPSGQKSGRDLDPQDKKDDSDTKKLTERTDLTNLAFRDVKTSENYESLCSSGKFGAISRIAQRNSSLESPSNLFTALRRRNIEKGKNWQEINPTSSNFSCIYQQSFCLGNEVPRLNARFVLNISPYLNQYLKRFNPLRELHQSEFARSNDFENFDVAINPEILKDKPITRTAVCLALDRQLHKILNAHPSCEKKLKEKAIQTVDISEDDGNPFISSIENVLNADLKTIDDSHINRKLDCDEYYSKKTCDNPSLWDSGYCEKTFEERSITPKQDRNENQETALSCCYESNNEYSDDPEILNVENTPNLFYQSSDELNDYNTVQNSFDDDVILKCTHEESDSVKNSDVLNFSDIKKNCESKIFSSSGESMNDLVTNELKDSKQSPGNEIKSSDEKSLIFDINCDITVENERDITIPNSLESASASDSNASIKKLSLKTQESDLGQLQKTYTLVSHKEEQRKTSNENLFLDFENILVIEEKQGSTTRASGVDGRSARNDKSIMHSTMNLEDLDLERIQNTLHDERRDPNNFVLSPALEAERSERNNSRMVLESDVTQNDSSRDPAVFDERKVRSAPRQMDRETGERSVAVESSVTTETTLRDSRFSTAVISRLTLEDWSADREDSVSVKTTVSEEVFRPTFEEFVPLKCSENISGNGACSNKKSPSFETVSEGRGQESSPNGSLPSSPRVDRLKGLLYRDEERRARTKFHHLATSDGSHVGGAMEGEWDRLLRDVLASVSELERWERRRQCDVSSDAEDAEQHPSFSQSDSSFTMEEEALSPNKGETPTKVKNLRFKLDPDVFDVPSDDSFYDDDDDDVHRGWRKQSRYRAFSSLELDDEPVRLVSVQASVVPAGQKMVARPVGIDLRVRLTEERQSKRAHVSTSPSQAKRRSPVSDRGVGWCQELSPVTENVDWRETFTPVTPECKSVLNGILKTPSPKSEPAPVESPNPFKLENGVTTNGVTTNGVAPVKETKHTDKPKQNGLPWRPVERKPFLLPRKKFEPDPEAIERITGYKSALSKPPLPPPISDKINASKIIAIKKAELARKQYLDNKAALAATKVDSTMKFQQFLNQAQNDRARIVTSVPDLAAIERAVTEQWMKERQSVSPQRESPKREDSVKNDDITVSRGSTPDDKWASYVQSCRQHLSRRSQSMSYLETDIDIIPVLDEDDKCASTSCLDESDEALPDPDDSDLDRSREDLDDSGRAKSEHELRIERSLRSLPIPDWYRRSEKTKTGFLLGSSTKEKRGWAAAKSLASSTSSLASCGLKRPVRSLRSSRENIPWSRSSASPDGPTLSLALAKAFREPYLGWRARTPTSSGVSSSPRASPPSWNATTDDEANGVSFDGEDAFGRTTSSEEDRREEPLSLDDTGADAVTVSMDTNDPVKLPGGEDTCDDINNMSMDTCELFDPASVVVPVDEDPSPQADTGDDIDNLSTDTTTTEGRKLDPKLKRYSYSQSIYHSEWDEDEEESRGDRKVKEEIRESNLCSGSPDHKVVWIESSFVGSRTTTSIMVLPEKKAPGEIPPERPASR